MNRKLFLFLFLFCLIIRVQAQVVSGSDVSDGALLGSTGTAVVVTSIQLSPPNPVIPYNQAQSFTAQATYSNGTQADVTNVATWASSNNTIATNSGPNFQCVNRGTVTVTATYTGISGTTILTCQSPTFNPQGTINTPQSSVPVTIVQFTASNGSSPYTFSSTNLPSFLSLVNTGCGSNQVNCSLYGAATTVGVYNFNVQATDALGNTACISPGCPVSLNVTAANAEDNTYCTIVGGVETVTGLSQDGPAAPLQNCNYTAIAWTPNNGTIIYVCPQGQKSGGVAVVGCANAPQPPSMTCYTTGGVFCSSFNAAFVYVYNGGGTPICGDIQIYATIDNTPTGAMNVYTEPTPGAPNIGNINCGPDFGRDWLWVRSIQYNSLPMPGSRVTPAWAGVTSIPGRPNYQQTSSVGAAPGVYMPMLRCEQAGDGCQVFSSQYNSILNGIRFIGVIFAAPHGRNATVDLFGHHVCGLQVTNGAYQCTPGTIGGLIGIGCYLVSIGGTPQQCSQTTNQGTVNSGSQHVIFDRVLASGCDDLTLLTCWDVNESLILVQGGSHISVIDSFLMDSVCMYGNGPCVDSHAIAGGNIQEGQNDVAHKYVDDYIESAGECFIYGGGTSSVGIHATDFEFRRNHCLKPITWKADNPQFQGLTPSGQVNDGWVNKQNTNCNGTITTGCYSSSTTCSIDPPLSGTQATCTPVIVNGLLVDVTITNTGSGYGMQQKANGKTAVGNPNFYFTDGGVTYTSCQQQISGTVNVTAVSGGSSTVTWVHGNKFISGLSGTQLTLALVPGGNTNFTVSSYINNTTLIISGGPSTAQSAIPYSSNLNSRGDCFQPTLGIWDVKNPGEFKHALRALFEGNHHEQNWNGQSDQNGDAFILGPRNASNVNGQECPTCLVQDVTVRYNLYNNTVEGISLSIAVATQGQALPENLSNISVHDNIVDAMNAAYWVTGTSPIYAAGGNAMYITNAQSPTYATNNVKFNHNTFVATLPSSANPLSAGAFLELFYNCQYANNGTLPAVLQGITITNNLGPGAGVKNNAANSNGCLNCNTNSCSSTPSLTALDQLLSSDDLLPASSGTYTANIVTGINPPDWVASNAYSTLNYLIYPQLNNPCNFGFYVTTTGTSSASGSEPVWSATCTSPPTTVNDNTVVWTKATGSGQASTVAFQNGYCSVAPTGCTINGVAGSCGLSTAGSSPNIYLNKLYPKLSQSGLTSTPTLSITGGTCSIPPEGTVYIGGAGNTQSGAWCFDHNGQVTSAWNGIINMSPYPTAQGGATNGCFSAAGGGNITVAQWSSAFGSGSTVGFVNFAVDASTAECAGPYLNNCSGGVYGGDLHLQSTSPFKNAANGDGGNDIGADVDLVLGTEAGTPSQYTGCLISGGYYQCPP